MSSRDAPGTRPPDPASEPAAVLWVTDEPPDRDAGGGGIRQAHLFAAVARAHPTDLLVVGDVTDPLVRAAARRVIELPRGRALWSEHPLGRRLLELALLLAYPHPSAAYLAGPSRRALSRAMRRLPGRYGVIVVEPPELAPLRGAPGAARRALGLHHRPAGVAREQLRLAPGPRQRAFRAVDWVKARALERRALERYDRVFVCSDDDAAALRGGGPRRARVVVAPNGVDLARYRPTPLPATPAVLLPGSFAYGPNVDAAAWLAREVWPRVRAARPDAVLRLVGRSPAREVLELDGRDGIAVHADVPAMAPFYAAARAVVVPLRVGTGTRLKALEALAAGRPLAGTTVGLEGLGLTDGREALIADDPRDLAAALLALLGDDALARGLAERGRRHAERHFGWEPIGRAFVTALEELL